MKKRPSFVLALAAACCMATPAPANPLSDFFGRLVGPRVSATHVGHSMQASFYGGGPKRYEPNARTANGELFNQWARTAAHRTLPFGTHLRVCHHGCVVVRINDRGPAVWTGRALDLSRGAARAIGFPGKGAVHVTRLD